MTTALINRLGTWSCEGDPNDAVPVGAERPSAGAIAVNTLTGDIYANTGTPGSPTWTQSGGGSGGLPSGLSYAGGALYPESPDDLGSEAHPWGGLVLAADGEVISTDGEGGTVGLVRYNSTSGYVELDSSQFGVRALGGLQVTFDLDMAAHDFVQRQTLASYYADDDIIQIGGLSATKLAMFALPAVDPEYAGQLYEDPVTHAVTVSQGAP